MEIVLTALELSGPGGVQTYLLIVASHLERLGHEVTLFSTRLGAVSEQARARGLRVCGSEDELPRTCDAVLCSDGASALEMADHYPEAVRGLIVHGADYDLHLPSGVAGVVSFAVAMNDVVARRLQATVARPDLARLSQPIDIARFAAGYPPGERARRVLLLGNYLHGAARQAVVAACERFGASWRQVGVHGELQLDPFAAILEADVVVGQGRSALEGMSCGRAVWVYGPSGGDGWVTEDNYAQLERDGFRGRAAAVSASPQDFEQALGQYRSQMGETNRRLVIRHHSPYDHAVALVGLLEGHGATGPGGNAPLREIARLTRTHYEAQNRSVVLLDELASIHARLEAVEAEKDEYAAMLEAVRGSRRWRAASLVSTPVERLRARLRR